MSSRTEQNHYAPSIQWILAWILIGLGILFLLIHAEAFEGITTMEQFFGTVGEQIGRIFDIVTMCCREICSVTGLLWPVVLIGFGLSRLRKIA